MYKNVLESIQGITVYPLISLAIFFTFFVLLIVWVVRIKKSDIEAYSKLPLEEDDQIITTDSKS
jgi:cytochrome c oxidase cbb3-type subunit 4